MRRAAHPSGCARCGAGAGCSAIKYQSLWLDGGRVSVCEVGGDGWWQGFNASMRLDGGRVPMYALSTQAMSTSMIC